LLVDSYIKHFEDRFSSEYSFFINHVRKTNHKIEKTIPVSQSTLYNFVLLGYVFFYHKTIFFVLESER